MALHPRPPYLLRETTHLRSPSPCLDHLRVGTTITYSDFSRRIGQPHAVRAVARACASNTIALAIPCHRVIRADGSLSGYRRGVSRKRALLPRGLRPRDVICQTWPPAARAHRRRAPRRRLRQSARGSRAGGGTRRRFQPDEGESDCGFGVRLYTGEPERYWIPRGIEPVPCLHFELSRSSRSRTDGDLEGTFDPLSFTVGCLDPAKVYPTD